MSRHRPLRYADGSLTSVVALVVAATGAVAAHGAAPSATVELVAAVVVDDRPLDEPVLLRRRGADLLIGVADLRRMGIATGATGEVALTAVPGLAWSFDAATQTLALHTRRPAAQTLLSATRPVDRVPVTPSGWGAIVTYDATASGGPGGLAAAALVDTSLFTPVGHAFATTLVEAGGDGRRARVDRLETGFTWTDAERLRRVTVGDFIPAATGCSRPVRMAGVQVGTDFGLRPDLVTFPVPAVPGSAVVPSTVDLIVNGVKTGVGEVQAGRFAVIDAPVQAGVNSVGIAVRDALGRETLRTVSLYASRALLRPGLTDWSLELGAVRLGFGSPRDRYGALAWSGSLRRGLSDRWTVELHGEGSRRATSLGAGLARGLGTFGQVDGSLSATIGNGRPATQFAVGFERIARGVHLTARFAHQDARYRDLAARYGSINRSRTAVLNIGFDLGRLGTIGGGVIALGRGRLANATPDGRPLPVSTMLVGAAGAAVVRGSVLATGTWSFRLNSRVGMVMTGGADLARRRAGFASIGLMASFGARTAMTTSATARVGGAIAAVEARRTALLPGEWGWHAGVARGGLDRLGGGFEYQGTAGRAELVAEQVNGAGAVRASVRGGLVVTAGGISAADVRGGSVALVETGGEAGVTIYRDNRPAGVTDAHGRLLVANLDAFHPTKLSVDPLALADDVVVDSPDVMVRPGERTGVTARLPLRRMAGLLAGLVDANGRPLPAGARARGPDGRELPIGDGGALFVTEARSDMSFAVRLPTGGQCVARLHVARLTGAMTRIDNVVCRAQQLAAR